MELLSALGLSIPAGLNAYIPLLVLSIASKLGLIQLSEPFTFLGEWWAMLVIAVLLIIELVADKFPVADSINDAIQTFVRPVAGALVALAASGNVDTINPILIGIAGLVLAGGVHAGKSSVRVAANTSTAGISAPVLSTVGDISSLGISIIAIAAPVLIILVIILLLVAFLTLRKFFKSAAHKVRSFGSSSDKQFDDYDRRI